MLVQILLTCVDGAFCVVVIQKNKKKVHKKNLLFLEGSR